MVAGLSTTADYNQAAGETRDLDSGYVALAEIAKQTEIDLASSGREFNRHDWRKGNVFASFSIEFWDH